MKVIYVIKQIAPINIRNRFHIVIHFPDFIVIYFPDFIVIHFLYITKLKRFQGLSENVFSFENL